MFGPFHSDRMFWHLWDSARRHGQRDRKGTISHVKEGGGERKVRAQVGSTRNGEPVYSPWLHTEENRSGGHRSEEPVKVGQNVGLTGYDWSTSSVSPSSEAKHAPRPPHAGLNKRTRAFGKKMYTGESMPDSGGSQGGGGGGGGAGGGGEEHHQQEGFINDQEEQLPEFSPTTSAFGSPAGGAGGGQQAGGQQGGQQGGGQSKPKVRWGMHEKGEGSGGHSFCAHAGANDDQDAQMQVSEKGAQLLNKGNGYWVDKGGQSYVFPPPKLKKCDIKLDKQKQQQSSGGGGGAGGGGASGG